MRVVVAGEGVTGTDVKLTGSVPIGELNFQLSSDWSSTLNNLVHKVLTMNAPFG